MKAVIYCRFSPRPNAKECDSNEKQEERCRYYINSCGYPTKSQYWFHDKSVSGKTLYRKGLQAAMAALEPGDVLVVDRNDRLARDTLIYLTIENEVKQRGCRIEFADGSPIADTPEGKLFQNILANIAQFQREKYAERTKIGLATIRQSGTWCGRPPYGWRKVKGQPKLVKDEHEQAVIQYIKKNKDAMTSNKIASVLCQTGDNIHWTGRKVRHVIKQISKMDENNS